MLDELDTWFRKSENLSCLVLSFHGEVSIEMGLSLSLEEMFVVDFVSQDLILCVDAKEKCTKFMETLRCIICWTYNSGA